MRTIAQATGARDAALDLVARQRARDRPRAPRRPRAPAGARSPRSSGSTRSSSPGHWTPQLVELAGGVDVLGFAGEHSEQTTWEAVAAARREVVVAMPCGYDAARVAGGGATPSPRAGRAGRPARRRGRRRRRTSPVRGRAWSTASSCWPTCCTPTGCAAPAGVAPALDVRAPAPRRLGDRRPLGHATSAPATATAASATHAGVAERQRPAPAVGDQEGDARRARRRPGRRCGRRSRCSRARRRARG